MNDRERAGVLGVFGVFALHLSLSPSLLQFLRPGMRNYLVATSVILLATAVAGYVVARRSTPISEPTHDHRGGWVAMLLAVPVVIGMIAAPGPLGAWAAARQHGIAFTVVDFDAAGFVRAQTIAKTEPEMRLADFMRTTLDRNARRQLPDVPVRLKGFVVGHKGGYTINRFLVGCCVADAQLVGLRLDMKPRPAGADAGIPNDTWIEALVRFDPDRSPSIAAELRGEEPAVNVLRWHRTRAPSNQYEYLYR